MQIRKLVFVIIFLHFNTAYAESDYFWGQPSEGTKEKKTTEEEKKADNYSEKNTDSSPQEKKNEDKKSEGEKDNVKDDHYFWGQPSEGTKGEKAKPAKEKATHTVTGTLAFLTDYRDRGISQTFRQPAVQGEIRYDHKSGIYAKVWGSNVDGTGNFITNTSLELDFYVGYKGKFFDTGVTLDCGIEYYWYPGGRAFVSRRDVYDSCEYYVGFFYKGFDIQFHQTITDYFAVNSENPPIDWNIDKPIPPNGHSWGSPYIETNLEVPLKKNLKLVLHAGYQAIINYPGLNFADWQASVVYSWKEYDFALTYVQSTAKKEFYNIPTSEYHPHRVYLGGAGIYAGVSHSF